MAKWSGRLVRLSAVALFLWLGPAIGIAGDLRVLSDFGQPIGEITIHYLPELNEELGPIYQELFSALPTEVRVVVLCPTASAALEFDRLWGHEQRSRGRSVDIRNVRRPISLWARDRQIARVTGADHHPAQPLIPTKYREYDEQKRGDLMANLEWASPDPQMAKTSPLLIEGGNVVANLDHIFIGANVYADNQDNFPDERELSAELMRELGNALVIVRDPNDQVPWDHVDMYLTPVDDGTLLVGSPAMGRSLLGGSEAVAEALYLSTDLLVDEDSDQLSVVYDGVARLLRQYGYRVLRSPVVPGDDGDWLLTYNNVLLDFRNGERTVYMPVYGIPALDEAAESLYRSLDYEVVPIDMASILDLGGALRCIANVTQRGELTAALLSTPFAAAETTPEPDTVVAANTAPADDAVVSSQTAPSEPETHAATPEPAAPVNDRWILIGIPLLIFFARIGDVSIGTVRLIFIARGVRTLAVVLGFFEVLIWVIAVSAVLVHLNNWINILAYAGGFAAGNAIGLWIEGRLAIGAVALRLISRKNGKAIAQALRSANYRVTTIDAEGRDSAVIMVLVILSRRHAQKVLNLAREIDPDVIATLDDVWTTDLKRRPEAAPSKAPSPLRQLASDGLDTLGAGLPLQQPLTESLLGGTEPILSRHTAAGAAPIVRSIPDEPVV